MNTSTFKSRQQISPVARFQRLEYIHTVKKKHSSLTVIAVDRTWLAQKKPALTRVQKPTTALFLCLVILAF